MWDSSSWRTPTPAQGFVRDHEGNLDGSNAVANLGPESFEAFDTPVDLGRRGAGARRAFKSGDVDLSPDEEPARFDPAPQQVRVPLT